MLPMWLVSQSDFVNYAVYAFTYLMSCVCINIYGRVCTSKHIIYYVSQEAIIVISDRECERSLTLKMKHCNNNSNTKVETNDHFYIDLY